MKILVVGSGGREQAIAWKLAQSLRVSRVFVAPGNTGTPSVTGGKGENVPIAVDDAAGLLEFASQAGVDLVVIGPETALEAGLADEFASRGIQVFGPSRAAARIELSKTFAKEFMRRHQIPTARFARFALYEEAREHLREVPYPVVIKTSGLAAGKGVIVPDSLEEAESALRAMMVDRTFGSAADEVVIEERLTGPEISLLAFCDGRCVRVMPPAQDHKRLLDGDRGPNTGGMGAYAPAPACPSELVDELTRSVLQPTIDGLRSEGTPFVGVLYAGLMLTPAGPQVLEFNCRFGDPETQALLPLLESDLLDIFLACLQGSLNQIEPVWKNASAACVVLASEGYPARPITGRAVEGTDHLPPGALLFHAGTQAAGERTVTAGGRVLCVTGTGARLPDALRCAYQAVEQIHFDGMQYRRDIASRALPQNVNSCLLTACMLTACMLTAA